MTFNSGEDFLDFLKNNKLPGNLFQIAITDLNFLNKVHKQINGIELIKKIKKTHPHIQIILTSAQENKELINNALSLDREGITFVPKNEDNFELFLDQVRYFVNKYAVKILKKRKLIAQTVFFSTLFIGICIYLYFKFFHQP